MLYKDCTSTGESLYFGFQLFPFSLAFGQSVCITGESSIRKEETLSAVVKNGRSYEEIMNFLNAESDEEKTENRIILSRRYSDTRFRRKKNWKFTILVTSVVKEKKKQKNLSENYSGSLLTKEL